MRPKPYLLSLLAPLALGACAAPSTDPVGEEPELVQPLPSWYRAEVGFVT